MGTANRVAKNTLILYARMGITMFISLYVTRLVLAALGASDFGIFNVVGGAVAMLMFLNAAMTQATQRFMSYAQGEGDEEKQKRIFNVSFLLHIAIGLILVFIMEFAGYFLFKDVLKIDPQRMDAAKLIYHFLVASTFVKVISVPYDAVINARENMLFVAVLGIFEAILKLAIAFYVTYTGLDRLASYGFLMAGLAILLLIITRIYCHRKYDEVTINFKKYYDKNLLKEMASFGGWSFIGTASGMLAFYGQGIVLNMFFGTIVNAAQGVANQLSGQLSAFAATMMKALNPILAKSEGAGNRLLLLKVTMTGSKNAFFLLMLFFVPVLLETKYIFNLWLVNIPEYTIVFCRLYFTRNLIDHMFVTLYGTISSVGNIKKFQLYSSILNILPIIVSYPLFKIGFPPHTIYIIFIIYSILYSSLLLTFAHLNCDLSWREYLKKVVFKCTLIFTFVFLVASIPFTLLNEGLFRLIIVIISTLFSFVFSIWFWGYDKEEKIMLKGLINQITSKLEIFKFLK